MNGRISDQPMTEPLARHASSFTSDLITLGELQFQLLACDAREATSRSSRPALAIAAAIVLALGTVPIILAAVSWLLVDATGAVPSLVLSAVAVVALVAAGGLAWWGWNQLTLALSVFDRSRKELVDNLREIKGALTGQSR